MTNEMTDTRKAEILCDLIANQVKPTEEMKAEFHRLRKLGVIEYSANTGTMRINYKNNKNN